MELMGGVVGCGIDGGVMGCGVDGGCDGVWS